MNQSIVRVSEFTQGKTDKNGKKAVYLNYVSGDVLPQKRVLAGTVAELNGFQVGKTYMVNWQETHEDEQYGKQYAYSIVQEVNGGDLLGLFRDRLSKVSNMQFTRRKEQSKVEEAAPAATIGE